MKKIIKILLVCLVTFGLTACSKENQDTTKTIKWTGGTDTGIIPPCRLHFKS